MNVLLALVLAASPLHEATAQALAPDFEVVSEEPYFTST